MGTKRSRKRREKRLKQQTRLALFETNPDESYEAQAATTPNEKEEDDQSVLTNIYDTLFRDKAAVWTAIFTCVLALFSYLLWKVSDQATQLAAAAQAAAVSSIGPGVTKVPNPDGKTLKGYNITYNFFNSGNTAAKTATMQTNVYTGIASPTKDLDFGQLPQDRITSAVIPPHSAMQMGPGFIALQDLEDVQEGRKHMFFWGWTVYNDGITSVPRLSEYCMSVEGAVFTKADHTDLTGEATILTNPCGVHFCFNEDCSDYKTRTK